MPRADPEKRKQYNRAYGRDYARKRVEYKPEGICSVGTCNNKTDGVHKKCAHGRFGYCPHDRERAGT